MISVCPARLPSLPISRRMSPCPCTYLGLSVSGWVGFRCRRRRSAPCLPLCLSVCLSVCLCCVEWVRAALSERQRNTQLLVYSERPGCRTADVDSPAPRVCVWIAPSGVWMSVRDWCWHAKVRMRFVQSGRAISMYLLENGILTRP